MKKLLSLLSILLLSFTLVACSSDRDEKSKEDKDAEKAAAEEKEKTAPICPQVAILRQLEIMKDYGREKPDPAELVAQAKMMSVDGDCAYQDSGIDVKFDVNMIAQRGPRLGGLHAGFPYFAAVVGPDETILNKENLTVTFGFSSGDKIATNAESLHIFIPLDKSKRETGPFYRVLVGFQLPQEQAPEPPASP